VTATLPLPASSVLPCQDDLRPFVPTVLGNLEYRRFRSQLESIDHLLRHLGVERRFVETALAQELAKREAEAKETGKPRILCPGDQILFQKNAAVALRCSLRRTLTGESYRGLAQTLAESELRQWFCLLGEVGGARIPSKSTLQNYGELVDAAGLRDVVMHLVQQATEPSRQPEWNEPVTVETVFLDSTAIELDIHYPVDWVLLRDGVRTLVQAILLIRHAGLKVRMEEPKTFLSRINRLCMQMTAAGKRSGDKKARKKIFRRMKAQVRVVMAHAGRHRDKLAAEWEQTKWSQKAAHAVLVRIETILAALPVAIRQAHERIIGERLVKNEEKLLSLYQPHASVIVRGKAGAEVEFGRQLFLAEASCGLVMDWDLRTEKVESDVLLMGECLARLDQWKLPVKAVVADRGFDSKGGQRKLAERQLENGIAPKDPVRFAESWKLEKFRRWPHRRAQTEARIGILKNEFLGGPLLSKGVAGQDRQVGWAALTHNLWLLADLRRPSGSPPKAN
jgi:hypothetical protein